MRNASQIHIKNILFLSNVNHNALCLIIENWTHSMRPLDAHQKFEKKLNAQRPNFYSTRSSMSEVSAEGTWTHIVCPLDALFRQHVISVKSRSRRLVFCLGRVGRILCVPGRTHWGLSGGHRGLNEKKPILAMILFLFPLMLLAVPKMISCRKARCYRTPKN